MRLNGLLGRTLAFACTGMVWSCGSGNPASSPLSPSSLAASARPSSSLSVRPFDYHEPVPTPTPTPDPAPTPTPDPAPTPTTPRTISIVGSIGSNAFTPNPIEASVGDMIVWTNVDSTLHHIVLDGGAVIGNVAPGESSAPMSLATSTTVGYHCTFHPSMVGSISINGPAAPSPEPPVDAAPIPSPVAGNIAGSVSANHRAPHLAVITAAQLSAGVGLSLDIQGEAFHSHTVTLTDAQVMQIAAGARVSQISSRETHSDGSDPHSHTVTFNFR